MPDKNKIEILPVAAREVAAPRRVAVGMKLARLQHLLVLAGDENAPHFAPAEEPAQDGRVYQAVDGQRYFRPQLRVGTRELPPTGPDVRFLKDAEGRVRLQFELEEAPQPGVPPEAKPFPTRVDAMTLHWSEGGAPRQRVLDLPTPFLTEDATDATKPSFSLRAGVDLDPGEVEGLYHALRNPASGARIEVKMSYGYWIDTSVSPTPQPSGWGHLVVPGLRLHRAHSSSTTPIRSAPAVSRTAPSTRGSLVARHLDLIDRRFITEVVGRAEERGTRPDFKTATLVRSVPFTFDPALEQNRPIYAAVEQGETLQEEWTSTHFGLVRRSSFPNSVYRVPDEVRMSFNPQLGTPHMLPALYRDEAEETRVRVVLRAEPWHDAGQLVRLRDELHRATAGALAAPEVVVGGYREAKLKLTGAFPEQIRALAGEEIPVTLERGFELTLDLSLEFYRFLCELLVSPVGLTGDVTILLGTQPAAGEGEEPREHKVHVPMRLNLDDMASLPVVVEVGQDEVSPRKVKLGNPTPAEIRIGECVPRLLQYDANSVAPIEVFEATVSAPSFPLTLPPASFAEVEVAPEAPQEGQFWNAVRVELPRLQLTQPARQVLDRIHEIAPSGSLAWQITVECPVFLRDPLPQQFENLHRVEVQLLREGFAAQQLLLGKERASDRVTMQRALREMINSDAEGLARFRYRVRNIYFDHPGQWSQEKEAEGANLFVFPNPPEND